MPITSYQPSFKEERRFIESGLRLVAGVDEVGRGCLAGPLVASAVI
jgi:ribonuclease HII